MTQVYVFAFLDMVCFEWTKNIKVRGVWTPGYENVWVVTYLSWGSKNSLFVPQKSHNHNPLKY
jgi:hypothetical protein